MSDKVLFETLKFIQSLVERLEKLEKSKQAHDKYHQRLIDEDQIKTKSPISLLNANIEKALDVAHYGLNDGGHHKMWVIDQMVRALTGDMYEDWIRELEDGEDGPKTYEWDTGVAP